MRGRRWDPLCARLLPATTTGGGWSSSVRW
jgi:hypothetical protein